MSTISETVRAMRAAGIDPDKILDVVLTIEDERLAKGRARQSKHRNSNRNANVTNVNDVSSVTSRDKRYPLPSKEGPPHTPPKETQPSPSPSLRSGETRARTREEPELPGFMDRRKTPQAALETVLDPTHASAVLEHRQRLRKPLTPHAAQLLAAKFLRCADPNAAADAMIANGWQGFEPEWLEGRTRPNGRGPPQSMSRRLTDLCDQPIEQTLADWNRTTDERNGAEDNPQAALRAIRDQRQ